MKGRRRRRKQATVGDGAKGHAAGDAGHCPARDRRYRTSWEAFADRFPYHHFVTLTFANAVTRAAAENALRRFVARLEGLSGEEVWWIMAYEHRWDGSIHFHGLLGGTYALPTKAIEQAWTAGAQVRVYAYDPKNGALSYITKSLLTANVEIDISQDLERRAAAWIRRHHDALADRSGVRIYHGTDREIDSVLLNYDRLYPGPWCWVARLRHRLNHQEVRSALDDFVVVLSGLVDERPIWAWGPVNTVGATELLLGGCECVSYGRIVDTWTQGTVRLAPYDPGVGPTHNFSDPLAVIELDHYRSPAIHEAMRRRSHRAVAEDAGS